MSTIEVGQGAENQKVELFFQDIGHGQPVVLIHGWPVSHAMWEHQMLELPAHGLRVIAYDRRGFGNSSKPWEGYDYDTFADDLKALLDQLDLQDVVLVGFSMGGGEVARYMSRHGGARVKKVAFISAVTPFMRKTADNPDGVDDSVFQQMIDGLKKDRPDFLTTFGKHFFNVGMLRHPVSDATLEWTRSLALPASPKATIDCVRAFSGTDFREDLKSIGVPVLIVHGDADQTVPIKASGALTAKALPGAQYKVYDGAPHGLYITHKDDLNRDLVSFIKGDANPQP
jgi:pimeloyl-ACP methyl ester carboxylesterase